jgi:hypothetical protein
MRMTTEPNFKKISQFIKNQTDQTLLIRQYGQTFKVNQYLVKQKQNLWQVTDRDGNCVDSFFSRKFAVLAAILLSKQMSAQKHHLVYLDQQMAIARQDHDYFQLLLQKTQSDMTESLYEARLSRARQILEKVRDQIQSMEKSLLLQ